MKNKRPGFTLLEIMLVVALIGIVTIVSYSVFFTGQKSFEVGIDKGSAQADHRILREYLTNELRYIEKVSNSKLKEEDVKKYTSLEIIKNTGNSLSLSKQESNSKKSQIFPTDFKDISIEINSDERKAYIEFTGIEGKMKSFTILLENYSKDEENVENIVTLSKDNKIIYYSYPQDAKEVEEGKK